MSDGKDAVEVPKYPLFGEQGVLMRASLLQNISILRQAQDDSEHYYAPILRMISRSTNSRARPYFSRLSCLKASAAWASLV